MFEPVAAPVVTGSTVGFFLLATIGYDPQRGMIRRAVQRRYVLIGIVRGSPRSS